MAHTNTPHIRIPLIIASHTLGIIPTARILDGSVIRLARFGYTQHHAIRRAKKTLTWKTLTATPTSKAQQAINKARAKRNQT